MCIVGEGEGERLDGGDWERRLKREREAGRKKRLVELSRQEDENQTNKKKRNRNHGFHWKLGPRCQPHFSEYCLRTVPKPVQN